MRLIAILLTPTMLDVLTLFLSLIWMLRDQKDKTRPLLVFALVINLLYGFLFTIFMGEEGSLLPWKYDHILWHIEQSFGLQAASIALPFQGVWRTPLSVLYSMMIPMMILWLFITRHSKLSGSLVLGYVAELVGGPLLYIVMPACGPFYAFGASWMHPPPFAADRVRLIGIPNAFPSLHVATAFVLLLLAPGKLWKAVAFAFLALTCLATLSTGEHYVIDLVPGLAFGAFAAAVGSKDIKQASLFLSTVLAWSLGVRFAYSILIAHPFVTRFSAALTIALAIYALWKQWSAQSSPAQELSPATS